MKPRYPRLFRRFRLAQSRRKQLMLKLLLPLIPALIISITTSYAQEGTNHIYLSGQITNIENGAPIAGHPVYIESNTESNGGFSYYLAAYTDAYGFFSDTILTPALDGSLVIYTYDENSGEYIKEEFFRFNWASEYHMNTGLTIIDSNTLTDFQANYNALKDTITNDSLSYFFVDETIGEGIISWLWDFGDGTGSTEKDPAHVYSQPGLYNVKLTVSSAPYINDVRTSTIIKKIKAGMRDYYHFGGHAFAGYFPVDIGTAYLYKLEQDEFIPIDTTEFDQYGFYDFPQLIEGNYKVKTFPSPTSVNAGNYFPTYFGDALLWTKSKTIELQETAWEYDILMVPSYEYETGSGFIDGVVTFYGTDNPPLSNTEVILFNEQDNNLTYIKSNDQGIFQFIELPYGTYKVMAEVPGMYTYPAEIVLNEENPLMTDLNIVVYKEEMPFSVGNGSNIKLTSLSNPYPNPAQSTIHTSFTITENERLHLFIIDNNGQVVQKQMAVYAAGDHMLTIDIANLSAGMYRIMVLADNEKYIKPFIKVN